MSHVSALRSADTGARNKPRSWEVPVQANTQDTPETASLRIDLWEAWLKKKLFGLAKAGRGSGLKKKLKVELNPCPKAIFFALIHPLLKHGRTLQCQNTSGCKHRTLVESDWGVLEDFCDFEQHSQIKHQASRLLIKSLLATVIIVLSRPTYYLICSGPAGLLTT